MISILYMPQQAVNPAAQKILKTQEECSHSVVTFDHISQNVSKVTYHAVISLTALRFHSVKVTAGITTVLLRES